VAGGFLNIRLDLDLLKDLGIEIIEKKEEVQEKKEEPKEAIKELPKPEIALSVKELLAKKDEKITYDEILAWWNNRVVPIWGATPIRKTKVAIDRERKFNSFLVDNDNLMGDIEEEGSKLGTFAREKGFIQFDWLMKPANLTKFLEGVYRDVEPRPKSGGAEPTPEESEEKYEEWQKKTFKYRPGGGRNKKSSTDEDKSTEPGMPASVGKPGGEEVGADF
jgi:hypothetical protein